MTTDAIDADCPDDVLLTLAKSAGLDEDRAYDRVWDMETLTPRWKGFIASRLHELGHRSYRDDDGFLSFVK